MSVLYNVAIFAYYLLVRIFPYLIRKQGYGFRGGKGFLIDYPVK